MSQVPPLLPPPPGETTDYTNPPSYETAIIAVNVVGLTLITTLLSARIITRTVIFKAFGIDDVWTLFAWAITVSEAGVFLNSLSFGNGRHGWDIESTEAENFTYWGFVDRLLLLWVYATVKVAMLESYRRIFSPNQTMRFFCRWGAIGISIGYAAQFAQFFFMCTPVQANWDINYGTNCPSSNFEGTFQGVYNVVTDLYLLLLPMPFVWNLKMTKAKRFRVTALLGVGVIAVAASATRLGFSIYCIDQYDPFWCAAKESIFGELEVYIGFGCTCTLVVPASFQAMRKKAAKLKKGISMSKRGSSRDSTEMSNRDSSSADKSRNSQRYSAQQSPQQPTIPEQAHPAPPPKTVDEESGESSEN